MNTQEMKTQRQLVDHWLKETVSYAELDAFCGERTQNQAYSIELYNLLQAIYIGSGHSPVFCENGIRFRNGHPVHCADALPKFLRFNECPVLHIPGHKKDREIFKSFYPVLTDNIGMYFRVALAWLPTEHNVRAAALLHISNRDFDTMRHTKVYVPVITNMDMRMDVVAMTTEAFMQMMLNQQQGTQHYLTFNPRAGDRVPTVTREVVPAKALEIADSIRNETYPEFYERMIEFVRNREFSIGAYTCGQFLLDLYVRN